MIKTEARAEIQKIRFQKPSASDERRNVYPVSIPTPPDENSEQLFLVSLSTVIFLRRQIQYSIGIFLFNVKQRLGKIPMTFGLSNLLLTTIMLLV